MDYLKLYLSLYVRPLRAMSRIIDEGNWLHGALVAIVVSLLFQFTVSNFLHNTYEAAPIPATELAQRPKIAPPKVEADDPEAAEKWAAYQYAVAMQMMQPRERRLPLPVVGQGGWWAISFAPMNALMAFFALVLIYVPGTLLSLLAFEPLGSSTQVLRRDYGPLLACALISWAAAHLPFVLLGVLASNLGGAAMFGLWLAAKLVFGAFMVCALRTVCGVDFSKAIAAVSVSWVSLLMAERILSFLWFFPICWILPVALGSYLAFSSTYRQQQSFRRYLNSCTVNPRDAEAHYQLGLIYQQRRQYEEALARFQRAVEIDEKETDAHFQIGRIARAQSRFPDAINHFSTVVGQDQKHAHHEIWREVGATYAAANMLTEARAALERYVAKREFDPEGLYLLGETLARQGDQPQAYAFFQRCIEAQATLPAWRRRQAGKWRRLAQRRLLTVRAASS